MRERAVNNRRRSRRSEQNRLRSIVERLADGILIVDTAGVIRFANPAAEHLFGRSERELVGTELGFPVLTQESAEVEVVRPGGETVTAELRIVEADWDGAADANAPAAHLVSLRDVTDRKRAIERERQLERERAARAEAEAASQAKSEFLAMMSHELRTPLNAVIGYAELLDLGVAGQLTADQRTQLARIRASGRHLLGLVNEVLDLAKIEAGRLTVNDGVARVGDAADAALALVQSRADEKGIVFVGQCLGDGQALYQGDEDRVRQILVNLLSNAVKFTDPGGHVAIDCGVSTQPDPEARLHGGHQWVYLRVRDTGVGIPQDHLPIIFDPFVQGRTGHTRPNDGSGLGLTISRRLARLMGGDLTVRSTLGSGSVFTLWLPAASKEVSAPSQWTETSAASERVRGLADVGELLLRELENVLETLTLRFRTEELVSSAKSLKFTQLADHIGTYLADVAGMLIAIEETGGQPSGLLADATEIQRVVTDRHGVQRARLGWTPEALRREYAVMREEIGRLIRTRARSVSPAALEEGVAILNRLLEQAEELSYRALSRTQASAVEAVGGTPDVASDRAERPTHVIEDNVRS